MKRTTLQFALWRLPLQPARRLPRTTVRSGQLLLGRSVCARWLGLRRRQMIDTSPCSMSATGHQRRQAPLGEVRDRIPQRPRRRVLRALEEQSPTAGERDPSVSTGITYC